jgi:hypothetical protein
MRDRKNKANEIPDDNRIKKPQWEKTYTLRRMLTKREGVGRGSAETETKRGRLEHVKASELNRKNTCTKVVVRQKSARNWERLRVSVGCKQCTRAGYKPNAFPNSVFARTLFQSMLTITPYFPEFFLYLLSLWATVCSISFVLYRRHGVVLRKSARISSPRGVELFGAQTRHTAGT